MMALQAAEFSHRRGVAHETVGDDPIGHEPMVLEQFPEQIQRCHLIAAVLHQHVEYLTFLVDGPPHGPALTTYFHDHFVEMPNLVGAQPNPANVDGDGGLELHRPAANSLVADVDAALGEYLLDIAQAQRQAVVEPNCQRMVSGGNR